MALLSGNEIKPDRWRERWAAGVPSCHECRNWRPTTTSFGWKCYGLVGQVKNAEPEIIYDIDNGHCCMFAYRSTKLEE